VLRNVLEDYLNSIKDERLFDSPFLSLLPAMGFRDVHYTHGGAEFGKDFIAKWVSDEGESIQYSFQLKAGNTDQPYWRDKVQGQMLEAVLSPRSHPHLGRFLLTMTAAANKVPRSSVIGFFWMRPRFENLT
jgi:hypothetical protein